MDKMNANKKAKEEAAAKQRAINSQWKEFSKTAAYKDLMSYMDDQSAMLLNYAESLQMPDPSGKMVGIDGKMSNLLLQNRRGVNIVRTYIGLRSE